VIANLEVCITTSDSCASATSPLITTLLPAVVGAVLGFIGALVLKRRDQTWQVERDRFAREMNIVRPLDEALVETQLRIENRGVPAGQSRWAAAREQWEHGWVRLTPHLTSPELESRYRAVGTILTELTLYDGGTSVGSQVMIAHRAIENARIGLAYFLRSEDIPPPSFPTSDELIVLLGQGDPDSLLADAPLREWLAEHEAPPWHG
jgi:hypothetical protein